MKSKGLFTEPGAKRAQRTLAQPQPQPRATLTPVLSQALSDMVHFSPDLLLDLLGRYGSPLHLMWPHSLVQNVEAFRAVLRAHALRFEIFYGAKANKSQALVRAAVVSGVGVDVSSGYELRDALRAGADSSKLCATGPAKTSAFHAELIATNALISIDSVEEFAALEEGLRQSASAHRVRVLLRYRPALSLDSRFGMGPEDLTLCLQRLAQLKGQFIFEGFHFHVGGYAHETRAQALRELIPYVDAARRLGLEPLTIDIGGGMPVRYVDSAAYAAFLCEQGSGHYRNARVPASFYPYGGPLDACEWLHRLLESPCQEGVSIAQYLKVMNLALAIEPGRSLVDQAAMSVFRITRVKPLARGHHVIFVEGSSFSACETWFASEFLVDPILLPAVAGDESAGKPFRAYIAGHSCLDDDVIAHRWIEFARRPQAGDLLVYANTGGYQMDLLENEFHRHPMPRRIVVSRNAAGEFEVSPDE